MRTKQPREIFVDGADRLLIRYRRPNQRVHVLDRLNSCLDDTHPTFTIPLAAASPCLPTLYNTVVLGIRLTPEVRDGLHALLFQTLLAFISAHDYVHIVHGHVQRRGPSSICVNEIQDRGEIGDIEQQTMELDADG